jgi:excisionase family DNA binding protein
MSSNIKIQRICEYCAGEFTAKTTVTRYCSDSCAKKGYKIQKRNEKIQKSNTESLNLKTKSIEVVKMKEILSVKEVASLLGLSIRTTYRLIDNKTIKAVNFSERITRIKRSDIDKFMEMNSIDQKVKTEEFIFDIEKYYFINEVLLKYHIAPDTLSKIIKRNNIPKYKNGNYTYISKSLIDEIFN